jgi:predicted DNA-binding protein with PD1-like motif
MRVLPVRLNPGEDVRHQLRQLIQREQLTAGWVMTGVGSLRQVALRLADMVTIEDDFEIIAISGTLARSGIHIHLAVADPKGTMLGGHLLPGCLVADEGTVELVVGTDDGWRFERTPDPVTGFDELVIENLKP